MMSEALTVRRGEIFGPLQPQRGGKSTTFKMECGLLRRARDRRW